MKAYLHFAINVVLTTYGNIRASKKVFFVSIATSSVAFSILGLFLCFYVSLSGILEKLDDQVRVIVYLEDSITEEQSLDIEELARKLPELESIKSFSRESAWEEFKENFSDKLPVLMELESNPLPASYDLKLKPVSDSVEKLKEIAGKFAKLEGVEAVDFGEQWISRFKGFMLFLQVFLVSAGGLLTLGLVLILSNTIELSIYSKQSEIELMLMIGATPLFIKLPFLLEGAVQGILGSTIALGFVKGFQLYVDAQFGEDLASALFGLRFDYLPPAYAWGIVLLSALVGWLGSMLSVGQFISIKQK
ncbi:MAG: hypothetical protein COV66_04025 [Nitrospinae bacterium CG11_big_fil_rev_8_21_14_0_20_45_15]|nr:MAG: hypothetical protein COV66_04025 [Nitrospinae bacterium CG11_big_fil_rev_8_21_14_0_20_45_15]